MDQTEPRWHLTEDIHSSKGKQYGRAGQRVTIIAQHDNVMIVEHYDTGERFSVNIEKLNTKHASDKDTRASGI